nr:unnamed protein product [Callosobruchus analis]
MKKLKKPKRYRTVWCKNWLRKREQYSHINLLNELKFAPKDWHNYLRMDEETYLKLLSMVTPFIKKQDTVMRQAIPPHERLTATLRFLATGRSYEDLKYTTIISPQALGVIIPETCDAIYKVLLKDYFKFPQSEEEWKNIAKRFEERWNFPHCLGAIDGKHIDIIPPSGSGSYFYNYKGRHSMVLLAVVDARYQFIMCDFGVNGRISDGGVLQNTTFYEKLQNKQLHIPSAYVFVADDAFALRIDTMKPFRQADLNSKERKIYNYRVSRARRIVENAFGILASRFRIYKTQINIEPKSIEAVVMASCALHNFLMSLSSNSYTSVECFDHENIEDGTIMPGLSAHDSSMEPLYRRNSGNNSTSAKNVREQFVHYFNNEGTVPWQDNFIH